MVRNSSLLNAPTKRVLSKTFSSAVSFVMVANVFLGLAPQLDFGRVEAAAPENSPNITSPTGGAVVNDTVNLVWEAPTGTNPASITYKVEVSLNSSPFTSYSATTVDTLSSAVSDLLLADNGTYNWTVQACDTANSLLCSAPSTVGTFNYDTVAPSVVFTDDVSGVYSPSDYVSVTVTESHPLITEYAIGNSDCSVISDGPFEMTGNEVTLTDENYTGSYTCVRATDQAGHTSNYVVSLNALFIDNTVPSVTITSIDGQAYTAGTPVLTGDTTPDITFEVIDNGSGVDTASIEVTVNGEPYVLADLVDNGSGSYTLLGSTLVAALTVDGLYEVAVTVSDNTDPANSAGDTSNNEFELDTTDPVVEITYPGDTDVVSGTVTVTGTITDENPYSYTLTIVDDAGIEATITVFDNTNAATAFDYNWVTVEGTYTLTLDAVDAVGLVAATDTISVTVDNTTPEVTITSHDDANKTEGADFTFTADVVENLALDTVTVDFGGVALCDMAYSGVGDSYTVDVSVTDSGATCYVPDGVYDVTVTAKDTAVPAHEGTAVLTDFVVDTAFPVADADPYSNNPSYVSADVDLKYKASDTNLGFLQLIIYTYPDEVYVTGEAVVITDGSTSVDSTYAVDVDSLPEGEYEFYLSVTDLAGQTSTSSHIFTVDKTAPVVVNPFEDIKVTEGDSLLGVTATTEETNSYSVYFTCESTNTTGSFTQKFNYTDATIDDMEFYFYAYCVNTLYGTTNYYLSQYEDIDDLINRIDAVVGLEFYDSSLIFEDVYTISYYVEDLAGNRSDADEATPDVDDDYMFTIDMRNATPAVKASLSATIVNEGTTVSLDGAFEDPSWIAGDNALFPDLPYLNLMVPDDYAWALYVDYGEGAGSQLVGFLEQPAGFDSTYTLGADGTELYFNNLVGPLKNTYEKPGKYSVTVKVCEFNQDSYDYIIATFGSDLSDDFKDMLLESYDVRSEGKCGEKVINLNVLDNPPVVGLTASPSQKVTAGTAVTLTANVTGGDAKFTYSWSGACKGATGATFTLPTTPGSYYCGVRVTDADGDYDDSEIYVTVAAYQAAPTVGLTYYNTAAQLPEEETADEEEPEEEPEVKGEEVEPSTGDTCEADSKLSGYVYYDTNTNDIREDDEEGIENVTVKVYTYVDGERKLVTEEETDASGYWVTYVCPGSYEVDVMTDDLPAKTKVLGETTLKVSVGDQDEEVDVNFEIAKQKGIIDYWWVALLIALVLLLLAFLTRRRKEDDNPRLSS